MSYSIKSKVKEISLSVDSVHKYNVTNTITDLGTAMKYQRQYKTSSSLIYSANLISDYVSRLFYSNKADEINISIELGWKKGWFINLSVKSRDITKFDVYEIMMLAISYTIFNFNADRQLTSEEENAIKEVLSKKEMYDIS